MKEKNLKRATKTDWKQIDALSDAKIDTTDIAPLDNGFFKHATLRTPPHLVKATIEIEAETLEWFRAQRDCNRRLNAALRLYAAAHQ